MRDEFQSSVRELLGQVKELQRVALEQDQSIYSKIGLLKIEEELRGMLPPIVKPVKGTTRA